MTCVLALIGDCGLTEDENDPQPDRKRWIGDGYPCFSLAHDGDHHRSAVMEEWVCSMVTMEYVWFLVSFLGESMMGSSSSDEEEKKENQVLQSFVQ